MIRAALQHLVREGFLIKQPGRGTFVRQRKERQRLHVGFLVIGCELRDPLFAAVLRGAENAAIEHEWVLHYQRIPYRPRAGQRMHPGSPEAKMIHRMVEEDEVKGFLVIGLIDEDVLEVMRSLRMPLVVLGSHQLSGHPAAWWDQVEPDDVAMGRMIGQYLRDLGHARVATPALQPPLKTTVQVLQGLGASFSPDRIATIPCDWDESGPIDVEKAILRELSSRPRSEWPTAIVCTDDAALAVMRAVRRLGLEIPRQISIVGLGDLRLNESYDPPLTSARMFPEEWGRRGFALLSQRLEGHATSRDPVVNQVPAELVIRGSTGKPPG